jgi:glc operon protein GlcG
VTILDQAGAQTVLQSARESAQRRNVPSAIAVVDPAGDLLAFQRMDGVRSASADLTIQKARTAAQLQRPTAEIEDSINQGRTAFVEHAALTEPRTVVDAPASARNQGSCASVLIKQRS